MFFESMKANLDGKSSFRLELPISSRMYPPVRHTEKSWDIRKGIVRASVFGSYDYKLHRSVIDVSYLWDIGLKGKYPPEAFGEIKYKFKTNDGEAINPESVETKAMGSTVSTSYIFDLSKVDENLVKGNGLPLQVLPELRR